LAPRKLLAFNAQIERHHLRLTTPIASWRFLRGEAMGDIFRPTPFTTLRKIPAIAGFPLLMACWAVTQLRRRRPIPLVDVAASETTDAGHGAQVACLQLDDWGRLDQAVAQAQCELVLIGRADLQAVLEKWLEQPGVWLAYCGRKWSLANGIPVASAMKIGERG